MLARPPPGPLSTPPSHSAALESPLFCFSWEPRAFEIPTSWSHHTCAEYMHIHLVADEITGQQVRFHDIYPTEALTEQAQAFHAPPSKPIETPLSSLGLPELA